VSEHNPMPPVFAFLFWHKNEPFRVEVGRTRPPQWDVRAWRIVFEHEGKKMQCVWYLADEEGPMSDHRIQGLVTAAFTKHMNQLRGA